MPTSHRWPQASEFEQRQRGCATHRRAASALFVILSEAKDLPSGIRLRKTLRQAQGDKAVLSLGRCFDKLSMTRPAQHDKTTTSETKKASVDGWAYCPVIVSPTVGIENVSRETFSAPIFRLFPVVSVFCALIGGYKIQRKVRFSAQPSWLRKI